MRSQRANPSGKWLSVLLLLAVLDLRLNPVLLDEDEDRCSSQPPDNRAAEQQNANDGLRNLQSLLPFVVAYRRYKLPIHLVVSLVKLSLLPVQVFALY